MPRLKSRAPALGSTHVSGTGLHDGAGSVTAPSGQREERPVAPKAAGSSAETSDVRAQLARLDTLDGAGLRKEWRRLHRAEPPRLSRDLLTRALAYRIQEVAFGGLPKLALRLLGGVTGASGNEAPSTRSIGARLKPGARLVREWHGRVYSVAVLEEGFEFEGRRYGSLTQIAREITSAKWSGPRFFGLTNRRAVPHENGKGPLEVGPPAEHNAASGQHASQDAPVESPPRCCSRTQPYLAQSRRRRP